MNNLNKYFKSQTQELNRSQIHLSDYNPRTITKEGKNALKKSIKLYGIVGGIVVNKRTNYTIVGGHQKITILDELNNFPTNDYTIRAEVVDIDEKTEKQLNITLNNPNVGGEWDYDALRKIIPDIDYKDAGLTDADLSMIGVDFLFQTEKENNINDELNDMMADVNEEHQQELQQRKEQRALENAANELLDRQERIAKVKEVKAQVKAEAEEKAAQMEAYIMLSFNTFEAKAEFCQKYGYDPTDKFIKGEDFDQRLEFGSDDEMED